MDSEFRLYALIGEHNCVKAIAAVTTEPEVKTDDYFADWVLCEPNHLSGWVGALNVCGVPVYKVENGEIVIRSDSMIRSDLDGDVDGD